MKTRNFSSEDVKRVLTDNPHREFTYAQIVVELGLDPETNARAVGSAMTPICKDGLHHLCVRVTDKNRQHHCKVR